MDYKNMTDEELREIAKKRVEARKGFKTHLLVYVLVNAFLIIIYLINGGGYPWFLYPLCGWGIGLGAHAMETRSVLSSQSANEIDDEIDKLRRM